MSTIAPRDRLAQAMSEGDLDSSIWETCNDLGLRRYHTYNSQRSDRGFPDLVIAGPGGVLFRELKRESEKPTPAQQAWLDVLAAGGADAGCWRPSDLLSGRVARELFAIARRPPQAAAAPAEPGEGLAGAAVSKPPAETSVT